jgi:uncharacterized membrane protein YphA (DoxX/SURF4 family)
MKMLLNLSRFFVGLLFIFSGLVKANDPLGLSYKMQEFFEVWHFHWLDNYTLPFSIIMIVFEIVAGFAVLLGWRMKLFSWLLLLLIVFFTFLTGYAFLSGKIKECGCFGDCIPITAGQSFAKDLFLLLLILFIFLFKERIKPVFGMVSSISILLLATILSFSLQLHVLQHLPLVDCLPYRIGVNIAEAMKPKPGARPDSVVTTFIYNRNGKQIEIVNNNFPKDFDESYKLVNRKDKLIREGDDLPAIKDFSLGTQSGNDTTQDLLSRKSYMVFVFVREMEDKKQSWNKDFNLIWTFCKLRKIPVFFISAKPDEVYSYLKINDLQNEIPVLSCDATAIKTAARANPTMYLIKNGVIFDKWGHPDFENAVISLNEIKMQ